MRAVVIVASILILLMLRSSGRASQTGGPDTDSNNPIERTNEAFGVGIALAKGNGGFLVNQVVPESAAALSRAIFRGDLITAVIEGDGATISLAHIDLIAQAVGLIRGPKGSTVRLTVVPAGTNTSAIKVVTLTRGELRGLPLGGLWRDPLTIGGPVPTVSFARLSQTNIVSLTSFPSKIVILEFWATWCAPCLKLMPELQREAESISKQQDVLWFFVSIDETTEKAALSIKRRGWNPANFLWADKSAIQAFGISAIPHMVVIGKNGIILHSGNPLNEDKIRALTAGETPHP